MRGLAGRRSSSSRLQRFSPGVRCNHTARKRRGRRAAGAGAHDATVCRRDDRLPAEEAGRAGERTEGRYGDGEDEHAVRSRIGLQAGTRRGARAACTGCASFSSTVEGARKKSTTRPRAARTNGRDTHRARESLTAPHCTHRRQDTVATRHDGNGGHAPNFEAAPRLRAVQMSRQCAPCDARRPCVLTLRGDDACRRDGKRLARPGG